MWFDNVPCSVEYCTAYKLVWMDTGHSISNELGVSELEYYQLSCACFPWAPVSPGSILGRRNFQVDVSQWMNFLQGGDNFLVKSPWNPGNQQEVRTWIGKSYISCSFKNQLGWRSKCSWVSEAASFDFMSPGYSA